MERSIDIEKVIKGLQIERECVSRNCNRDCGRCDLVQDRDWLLSVYDDALELLKEQEAVPVIQREIMHMLFWCCGSCGVPITDGDKFCRMCGKEVKWNDKPRSH